MKNNKNKFSVSVIIMSTDERNALIKTVNYINTHCTEKIDKTIIVLSRNASAECLLATKQFKKTIWQKCGLYCSDLKWFRLCRNAWYKNG